MLFSILGCLFGRTDENKKRKTFRPLGAPIPNDIICDRYRVKGKYPGTGRMRTTEIIAWDQASDEEILKMAGFVEPYEIERIGLDRPTERQVAYARDLGILVPSDASKDDVSILISRALEHYPIRQNKAPKKILEILIKKMGVYIPTYAGEREMNFWYLITLKTAEERYAYFAMKVYAQNTGKNYRFIHEATAAEQEKFYAFARKYKDDKSFVQSYERYNQLSERYNYSEITITGEVRRQLKAYKLASDFFSEN